MRFRPFKIRSAMKTFRQTVLPGRPLVCLWIGLLCGAHTGLAQEQSVKPGINDQFKDPNLKTEEWAGRFETESREVFAHRERIVKTSGVKPGMAVADIGAGTGLFTMLFAEAVGKAGST